MSLLSEVRAAVKAELAGLSGVLAAHRQSIQADFQKLRADLLGELEDAGKTTAAVVDGAAGTAGGSASAAPPAGAPPEAAGTPANPVAGSPGT
jgi:hypothetical protein